MRPLEAGSALLLVLAATVAGCARQGPAVLAPRFARCELWRMYVSPQGRYLAFFIREWNKEGTQGKGWAARLTLTGRPKVSLAGAVGDWPPSTEMAVTDDGRVFVWNKRSGTKDLRVFRPGTEAERIVVQAPYKDASYAIYWIDDAGKIALATFGWQPDGAHREEARVYDLNTGTVRVLVAGEFWVLGFAGDAQEAALLARWKGSQVVFSALPLEGGEERELGTVEVSASEPPDLMGCASGKAAILFGPQFGPENRIVELIPLAGQAQGPLEIEVDETLAENVSRDGQCYAVADEQSGTVRAVKNIWGHATVKQWEFPRATRQVPFCVAWHPDAKTLYVMTLEWPRRIFALDTESGRSTLLMRQAETVRAQGR